ncbi:hypothetical protein PV327_008142 [Microctonus hyperodae]|uniref:BTB domain-containing protein n=1 Tax=Microctonus hyperodae TaxID=165561 RepID=A0AA39KGN0_MICHY|nr:hypothetical protein PV327_008142 [Microctonus hyperodae]
MYQPLIKIERKWSFKYKFIENYRTVDPYWSSFVDPLIPDVKFNIIFYILDSSHCRLIVSKTPSRPANASVRIVIETEDNKKKTIDFDWVDDRALQRTIKVQEIDDWRYPQLQKPDSITSYRFTCIIKWEGFNYSKQSIIYNFYSHLKNFLTVPELSDMMIVIDENEIPVHKVILAAHSRVFLAMFKSGMTESSTKRIVVTDIEIEIMKKVVEFMYTGTINPVPQYDVMFSIMKVADKYEILDLKEFCEYKLSEKITIENALEIHEKNSLYGGPLLKKNILSFMVKNSMEIIASDGFQDFYRRKPELLSQFFIHSIVVANMQADNEEAKNIMSAIYQYEMNEANS